MRLTLFYSVTFKTTRPIRPSRCAVWIVERYRSTDRPKNGHSQLERCSGAPNNGFIRHNSIIASNAILWRVGRISDAAAVVFHWAGAIMQKTANKEPKFSKAIDYCSDEGLHGHEKANTDKESER